HFRQRVVLVHELRQLRGAEEFLDRGSHRLGVDQFLRGQAFGLGHRQALLHGALDADQAHAEYVLGHFADRTHATVAQVVDVVHHATAVADLGQHLDHVEDVGRVAVLGDQALGLLVLALGEVLSVVQHRCTGDFLAADAAVELHPAHGRQVVTLEGEEQVVEQVLRGVLGRRFARTHHAVDLDQRFELGLAAVDAQGVRQVRAAVEVVDPQRADGGDTGLAELGQVVVVDLVVRQRQQFTGVGIDDVLRQDAADEVAVRHGQRGDARGFELLDVARGDAAAGFDDDLVAIGEVEVERFATQAFRDEFELDAFLRIDVEGVDLEELAQHFFVVVTERAQQHGHRQLAAAIDTGEQRVLRVELEVQPGAAVRNDAGAVQQLARRMGLAAVVVEEHARRTVQLRDDDALGAVDDEGAVAGHQGQFAHVDLLLLHILDRLGRRLAVVDNQAHGHAQRRAEGQAAVAALTLVEGRLAQIVADVFQPGVAGVAGDRENGFQGRMQAALLALAGRGEFLQELTVGVHLDRQQVGHVQHGPALAEVLADPLFLGEGVRHGENRLGFSWLAFTRAVGNGNCQWEVAGIAGTSTPSPATSHCQLVSVLLTRYRSRAIPRGTAKGRELSPPAFVVACVSRRRKYCLLELDSGASRFEILLELRSVVLRHGVLDDASGLDEVLGFLQAQAGDGADGLDDLDLLLAGGLQDHLELGLLFDRSGGGSRAGGHHDRGGGGDAELLFDGLDQLHHFHQGLRGDGLDDLLVGKGHFDYLWNLTGLDLSSGFADQAVSS